MSGDAIISADDARENIVQSHVAIQSREGLLCVVFGK
jgi:hypothetical protein